MILKLIGFNLVFKCGVWLEGKMALLVVKVGSRKQELKLLVDINYDQIDLFYGPGGTNYNYRKSHSVQFDFRNGGVPERGRLLDNFYDQSGAIQLQQQPFNLT